MGSTLKPTLPSFLLPWMLLLLCQCSIVRPRHRNTTISNSDNIPHTDVANNTHNSVIRIRWPDQVLLKLRKDGLREFRIAFQGVLVLETSSYPHPLPAAQHTVRLRQMTDGKQLVHAVMDGEVIKDCRWSTDVADVVEFIDGFVHGVPRRPRPGDALGMYDDNNSAVYVSSNTTYRAKRSRRGERKRNPLLRGVSMPLRTAENLGRFSGYLQVSRHTRACRRFQSQVRQYLGVSSSRGGKNATQVSSGKTDSTNGSRRKRDLMTGWFIFPGTKWCGSGDIGEHENDLGYDEALDTCCRDHDLCPHIIPRFTWRYGLFNFQLHTLTHCRCDKRFRRCLKKSTSPAAHMVGKIFFNVMGSQCFKFTKERTCKRRNWWGKCKRYGFTKVAHPKKQRTF